MSSRDCIVDYMIIITKSSRDVKCYKKSSRDFNTQSSREL